MAPASMQPQLAYTPGWNEPDPQSFRLKVLIGGVLAILLIAEGFRQLAYRLVINPMQAGQSAIRQVERRVEGQIRASVSFRHPGLRTWKLPQFGQAFSAES